MESNVQILSTKDFESNQEIRWCPGCGDFAILKQMQIVFPQLGVPKEKFVIVSGIGCSSRLPYYMNTYGMHTIHGRATAIATGIALTRPDLSVWVVTGDGDAMSIGGNHLIHTLRRNLNVKIVLFNNQIYGLTKGQFSPTSAINLHTKSSPEGTKYAPFNTLSLALGAGAMFIARSIDREAKHLQEMLKRSHTYTGTSFLEVYQNCHIFNDGAFDMYTDRKSRKNTTLFLEHQKPLQFGDQNELGIVLDGFTPKVVNLNTDSFSPNDLWIHDENDSIKAAILAKFKEMNLPEVFGVLYESKINKSDSTNICKTLMDDNQLDTLLKGANNWKL